MSRHQEYNPNGAFGRTSEEHIWCDECTCWIVDEYFVCYRGPQELCRRCAKLIDNDREFNELMLGLREIEASDPRPMEVVTRVKLTERGDYVPKRDTPFGFGGR